MKHSTRQFFPAWSALIFSAALLLPSPALLHGQTPTSAQAVQPKLSMESLNELLAPVALYPDALVALILPASTLPSDVVLAARYLERQGDINQIAAQPWDDSLKSLANYPDVLLWMNENLEWTSAVGEAFVEQPADVMNSIQALRAQAKAAGNLVDTPEQVVVVEKEVIRIVPAVPEVIYVPQYNPQVVYVQSYSPVPVITFGAGFAVGAWLSFDFDWGNRCLYRGSWWGWNPWPRPVVWNTGWNSWNRPIWNGGGNSVSVFNQNNFNQNINIVNENINVVNINPNTANVWQPSNQSRREFSQRQRNETGNVRFTRNATTEVQGNQRLANSSNRGEGLPRPSRINADRAENPDRTLTRDFSRDGNRARLPVEQREAISRQRIQPITSPTEGRRVSSTEADRRDRSAETQSVPSQRTTAPRLDPSPVTESGQPATTSPRGPSRAGSPTVSENRRADRTASDVGRVQGGPVQATADRTVPRATRAPTVSREERSTKRQNGQLAIKVV
jgi:hypothetical protein